MSKILKTSMLSSKTANTNVLDLIIRHGVFVERYKTGTVNKILAMFNRDITPDIERKLLKHLGSGTFTEENVKRLAADLKDLSSTYNTLGSELRGHLSDFAMSDAGWTAQTIMKSVPVSIDLALPDPATLKALATNSYVRGKFVKDWFSGLANETRDKVVQQVNIGMVEGEGIADIVRRIKGTQAAKYTDGILNASRRNIEAVVRTSVSNVNNEVRRAMYKENSDIISSVQVVATLDDRTCPICMALDGKVYDVGYVKMPPYHWNCRCSTVPVMKSWKELGINLKEAPIGTRASMDGQVPASMTYGQWLAKQDGQTQDEILGKGKADLFRRGRVPITKFVDSRNKPLTLAQLEKVESRLKAV